MSQLSQQQKVLTIMCQGTADQWYHPYDFMQPSLGTLFVGYEASARLSELAKGYPEMIESQRSGKYMKRRIRRDTVKQWLPRLPRDLQQVFNNIPRPTPTPVIEPLKQPEQTALIDVEPTRKPIYI